MRLLPLALLGCVHRSPQVPWGASIPPCESLLPPDMAGQEWRRDDERVGLYTNAAWLYLRLYKVGVSSGDGDRCTMFPSCSAYTMQAVERYGPVLGGWAGAARITADHDDPGLPLCVQAGRLLRVDLPQDALGGG